MMLKKCLTMLLGIVLTLPVAAKEIKQETAKLNDMEVPWLSNYYIRPFVSTTEDVVVKFYVTDWYQSEYRLLDDSHRFHAKVTLDDEKGKNIKTVELKDIKAGDHTVNLGKLQTPGLYKLAFYAMDVHGRKSPSLFHEFRVRTPESAEIPEKETYRMKEYDLKMLKASNKGDYGMFYWVKSEGTPWQETAKRIEKIAEKVKAPSGRYVIVASGEKYVPEKSSDPRSAARGAQKSPIPQWLPDSWSWKSCKVVYADDYDHKKVEREAVRTGNGLNALLRVARKDGYRKVVLYPGVYRISHTTPLMIPDGMTLDLNGSTIKLNQFTGCKGLMIRIRDAHDSHVINGIVEGDYFEHDYKNSDHNSEWVCGIGIDGDSRYSSFERLLVRYITGYGVTNGFHGQFTEARAIGGFEMGGIDEKTGAELPDAPGVATSYMVGIKDFYDLCGYVTVSKYLGYQGIGADEWNVRYHFYDDNEKYLETIHGLQYKRVRIPPKAGFLRVSVPSTPDTTPLDGTLTLNMFKLPWNCWVEDVFILSARCVGMAPAAMYNHRIQNCSFVRSGENLAKCAFDAEDGWDMMQDVWIYRNKFFKNPLNELLTCAGHNFIIEDNEARLHLWDRTKNYVIRNNLFSRASYGAKSRVRTLLPRIENNTYTKMVVLGSKDRSKDENPDAPPPVNDANDNGERKGQDENDANEQDDESVKLAKTAPDNWFITMKDAEAAPKIICLDFGFLVGVSLKKMEKTTINLYKSELSDSTGMLFTGTKVISSRLKDVDGLVSRGKFYINDSLYRNGKIQFHSGEIVMENADLRNVTIFCGYWVPPVKITLKNCIVNNNSKPLLRTGVYSIGDIKFINCAIDTGTAPAIEVYDMRSLGIREDGIDHDRETGKIRFENCTFTNRVKHIISLPKGKDISHKYIEIDDDGNHYKGDVLQRKPARWYLRESNGTGRSKRVRKLHRGRLTIPADDKD